MTAMRFAAKADANARAIVAAFRALGCTVEHVVPRRAGVPDLLVGHGGRTHLVEVKTRKGRLREAQVEWAATWRGESVVVVRTVEDVALCVEQWRTRRVAPSDVEVDASDWERPRTLGVRGELRATPNVIRNRGGA